MTYSPVLPQLGVLKEGTKYDPKTWNQWWLLESIHVLLQTLQNIHTNTYRMLANDTHLILCRFKPNWLLDLSLIHI